jgi:hypothetical protein
METITVQRPRDVHSQNNILEPQLRAASRFEDNCGSRNCVVAADNVDIFQPNEVVESERSCSLFCGTSDQGSGSGECQNARASRRRVRKVDPDECIRATTLDTTTLRMSKISRAEKLNGERE